MTAATTSAGTKEPVASTITPVASEEHVPPINDPKFCMLPLDATYSGGAAAFTSAQMVAPATELQKTAAHSQINAAVLVVA